VLEWVEEGLSYRLIGRNLGLSKNTAMKIVNLVINIELFWMDQNNLDPYH
jgi:hypothetical protein